MAIHVVFKDEALGVLEEFGGFICFACVWFRGLCVLGVRDVLPGPLLLPLAA